MTPRPRLPTVEQPSRLDETIAPTTALPFSFAFFGTAVSHFAASSNGYVQLLTSASGGTTQQPFPQVIPWSFAPDGLIAPLWDDLISVNTTALRTQVFGTGSTRHLTLEWKDWSFFNTTQVERVTFQVKLFETTNAIELHYCTLAANGATTTYEQGFNASVGIEALNGTQGVQHSYRSPVLSTGTALHFE